MERKRDEKGQKRRGQRVEEQEQEGLPADGLDMHEVGEVRDRGDDREEEQRHDHCGDCVRIDGADKCVVGIGLTESEAEGNAEDGCQKHAGAEAPMALSLQVGKDGKEAGSHDEGCKGQCIEFHVRSFRVNKKGRSVMDLPEAIPCMDVSDKS